MAEQAGLFCMGLRGWNWRFLSVFLFDKIVFRGGLGLGCWRWSVKVFLGHARSPNCIGKSKVKFTNSATAKDNAQFCLH